MEPVTEDDGGVACQTAVREGVMPVPATLGFLSPGLGVPSPLVSLPSPSHTLALPHDPTTLRARSICSSKPGCTIPTSIHLTLH